MYYEVSIRHVESLDMCLWYSLNTPKHLDKFFRMFLRRPKLVYFGEFVFFI